MSSPQQDAALTLKEFQAWIRTKYHATDSARGVPGTFLWLSEEVGELAHALGQREKGKPDQENLREEFADVLAWLTTLANITGVDLEQAVREKYMTGGGPAGTK